MKKRKGLLAASLAAAMMVSVCGCGVNVTTDKEAAAETTAKAETTAEAGKETEGTSSDEAITLKIIDWSDSTKARREEFHKKFMEENPNKMCIRDSRRTG